MLTLSPPGARRGEVIVVGNLACDLRAGRAESEARAVALRSNTQPSARGGSGLPVKAPKVPPETERKVHLDGYNALTEHLQVTAAAPRRTVQCFDSPNAS